MDKAEFIERLTEQFRGIIAAAERGAAAEINSQRGRLDHAGFIEWFKDEQRAAAAEPALKPFDRIFPNTPEGVSQQLAEAIDFLGDSVDWFEQWGKAIEVTARPWKENKWKYKPSFAVCAKAFRADARARVFSQYIEPPAQVAPGKYQPTTFDDLFLTDEGKAAAIDVAERLGLIGRNGDGKLVWHYIHTTGAILAFFQALQDRGLIYEVKPTPGCKMIAKRFDVMEVKNYKSANFTASLRKKIKGHLPKHRDNNGDNNGEGI